MKFMKSEKIEKKSMSIRSVRDRFWKEFIIYKTLMKKDDQSSGVEPSEDKKPFFDIMAHLLEKEKDAEASKIRKETKKDQIKYATNEFKKILGGYYRVRNSTSTNNLPTISASGIDESEIEFQVNDIPSEASSVVLGAKNEDRAKKRKRDVIAEITESKNAIELRKIELEKQKSTIEEKRIELEVKKSQMEHEEKMKKMVIEEKKMQQQEDMTRMLGDLLAL